MSRDKVKKLTCDCVPPSCLPLAAGSLAIGLSARNKLAPKIRCETDTQKDGSKIKKLQIEVRYKTDTWDDASKRRNFQ